MVLVQKSRIEEFELRFISAKRPSDKNNNDNGLHLIFLCSLQNLLYVGGKEEKESSDARGSAEEKH